MPKILAYDEYYSKQMQFIDHYIRTNLDVTDTKRLQRIQQKQFQQSIHFLDDFLNIEQGKELDTTRIGYPPLADVLYDPNQIALAPWPIKPENRRFSRYRLIYGPVDFYLGKQLEEPTEIPVITTCAPNMMGSSPLDLEEFSTGGIQDRILKELEYGLECKKLADFIVGVAKQQGRNRLIMPAFGVGIYINKLNHSSQIIAREKMYTAFAEAARKHQIQIDWIVWAKDANAQTIANTLSGYSINNPYMKPTIHNDMMLYAEELVRKNEKIVLLNPGSDRTVGGMYTTKNPHTLEEQIAQQSDLLLLHTQYNQPMVKQFYVDFAQRKKKKEQYKKPTSSDVEFQAQKIALGLQNALHLEEKPWILRSNRNYKVSFKDPLNAQIFVELLHTNNINKHSGEKKKAKFDNKYHVVYLTPRQYQWLAQQDITQRVTNLFQQQTNSKTKTSLGTLIDFKNSLQLLKDKMDEFKGIPEYAKANRAAYKLYQKLTKAGAHYFKEEQSQESYKIFKNECENNIKTARLELDKHRGFTKILINIVAIIFSAGIGYAIAAGINMAMNKGKCTFFSTDSSLKINTIEDNINRAAPAA